MPYMYCNQEGCNETVKLPAQYCAKHKRLKVPNPLPEPESVKPLQDTTNLDLLDNANKYFSKHTPFEQDTNASDLTLKVDADKVSKSMNTEKTTK